MKIINMMTNVAIINEYFSEIAVACKQNIEIKIL